MQSLLQINRWKKLIPDIHNRDRLAEEIRSTVVYHVNKEIQPMVEAMTERVLQEEITPVEAASEILNRYKRQS